MNQTREPALLHTRTSRGEGWRALITALYTGAGLGGGILLTNLRQIDPVFFWTFLAICGTILCLVIVAYVIPNFLMDRRFTIRVFDDHIECDSPHASFGPSYNIAFADIQFLEYEPHG